MGNKILFAHLTLFLANLIYAISFPIAKEVMEGHIGPVAFVVFRVLGASLLFWLTSLLFIREKIDRKDFPRLVLLAVFGVACNQMLFLKGLHLTTPIAAAIMMITSPILVLVISFFLLSEKLTLRKITGVIIGFAGAALLILMREDISGRENTLLGNLFVFLNALSWGIYLVLVKPLMKKYHTVTILKWVFLMGLFMVAPFGWSGVSELDVQAWPSRIIWFALFVIVLTTFAAYLLNTYSLKALSPTVVSAYIYLQPLLTSLFAIYLFQNDRLTPGKIVSGVLIFLGVYLVSYSRKK